MRTALASLLLVLTACRPVAAVERSTPLNFAELAGPTVFNSEADLLTRWNGPLKALYDSAEEGTFEGVDKVPIRYRVVGRGKPNAVVLIAGRTEPMVKFAEVVDDLLKNDFMVFALDVRGQGASGRMLPNTQKGYVFTYQDYVSDLHTFITTVVKGQSPRRVFLLSHSMGGAITTLYADQHPDQIDGLAMTSPMLEINTGSFPPPIASTLAAAACSASDGTAYAIGSSDYVEETDFASSSVTNSEDRWKWKQQILKERADQRIGGLTWHWLCESLKASGHAAQLGRYSPVPTLILQAGADTVVKPAGQKQYCTEAPRCQLVTIAGAKHELLQEKDSIRNEVMSDIVKFFGAQVTP